MICRAPVLDVGLIPAHMEGECDEAGNESNDENESEIMRLAAETMKPLTCTTEVTGKKGSVRKPGIKKCGNFGDMRSKENKQLGIYRFLQLGEKRPSKNKHESIRKNGMNSIKNKKTGGTTFKEL
jgi:hypothetical protein